MSFDELHAQPSRDLWDVLTAGAGSGRKQPVWIVLTTAGDDPDRTSIGWEIHQTAVAIRDARQNARDNQVSNVDFLCGDAAKEMPELVRQGSRQDVVVLDPPRAGCEQRVLEAIAKVRPQRVVYVSCNPASLARDAAILRDKGFVVRKVQPVDMFPHTSHVETVCLLTLR